MPQIISIVQGHYQEIRLWKIQNGHLREQKSSKLNLEERLETWIEEDISILSNNLLVIGRQVPTDFGGKIDLVCLDDKGDVVIVELKRDKTHREITAQVLDYASWVKDLSNERVTSMADDYLGRRKRGSLDEAFRQTFHVEVPEVLNEGHSMLIVGSQIDPASERIIEYLSSTYGVSMNAATFQYFKCESGEEYLGRTFLIEPTQVEIRTQTQRVSKRRPNLTLEALQRIAEERGVGNLYSRLVPVLEKSLYKSTTISSLVFSGNIGGSRKAILSLLPSDSSPEDGLRFQMYFSRFRSFFNTDQETVLALLPEHREDWKIVRGANEDGSGYAGYFRTEQEVDRFISGLKKLKP